MRQTWKAALEKDGVEATLFNMSKAVRAETFLLEAVYFGGVDWCINRLQQLKKGKPAETMLNVILETLSK